MHPVTRDQKPRGSRKHQVEHDMAMPEDKEVDVRVCLEVIFCEEDHILVVFAQVFGSLPCLMFFQPAFSAAERLAESEAERPAGMDARIQPLAEFIAEKGA